MPLWVVAQDFEGQIIYQNQYVSKSKSITSEDYTRMMGSQQDFYIKEGYYLSLTNGDVVVMQLYRPAENKLYTQTAVSDSLYWTDANENGSPVKKAELKPKTLKIKDFDCDELTLTTETGIEKYYFNASLKLDPKLFEKHLYNNWAYYLSKAKAVPLKIVIEHPDYTFTSTALQINAMKLDLKLFDLPKNPKLVKSPF